MSVRVHGIVLCQRYGVQSRTTAKISYFEVPVDVELRCDPFHRSIDESHVSRRNVDGLVEVEREHLL